MRLRFHFYLILICLGLLPFGMNAHHIWGGVMSYRAVADLGDSVRFEVLLEIARTGNWNGAYFDNPAFIGIWRVAEGPEYVLVGEDSAMYDEISVLDFEEHEEYVDVGDLRIQVTRYRYYFALPRDGNDYFVGYRRCCRTDGLVNIFDEDSESPNEPGSGYGITITSGAIELGNSSPRPVGDNPEVPLSFDYFIKSDKGFARNFGFIDSDGDSLVYNLSAPRIASGIVGGIPGTGTPEDCDGIIPSIVNCPPVFEDADYQDSFSVQKPFGLDQEFSLDTLSGEINGFLTTRGYFSVGIRVDEYRGDSLLSRTYFDYNFLVRPAEKFIPVSGTRFFDENGNGVLDSTEGRLINRMFQIDPKPFELEFGGNGQYRALVRQGDYQITDSDTLLQIGNTGFLDFTADTLTNDIVVDVPYTANRDAVITETRIVVTSTRCNRESDADLLIQNSGTVTQSGQVTLTLDDIVKLRSIDIPGVDTSNLPLIKFNYAGLAPFHSLGYKIGLSFPGEEFAGDTVEVAMEVESFQPGSSGDTLETSFVFKDIVTCGIDPNEKFVYPNRTKENYFYSGEKLVYTVTFENIGNDTVFDVRIQDHLDHYLDRNSLKVVDASHEYFMKLEGDHLSFHFEDIALPFTAQSPKSSSGYVTFSIRPLDDLQAGTTIYNMATIIFDENQPFSTNMISSRLAEVQSEGPRPLPAPGGILVYPNPSTSQFTFELAEELVDGTSFHIWDILGKEVSSGNVSGTMFRAGLELSPGLYVYEIRGAGGNRLFAGKIWKVGR